MERAFQLSGQLRLAGDGIRAAAFFRQVVADAAPQVAVGGLLARHGVVGYRHARDLDDAGLDGVDQGKIRNHPRE